MATASTVILGIAILAGSVAVAGEHHERLPGVAPIEVAADPSEAWYAEARPVVEAARQSVVALFHTTEPWPPASGYVASPTMVVTARHVAYDWDGSPLPRTVVTFEGERRTATPVAESEMHDLAVMELDEPVDVTPLEIGDDGELQPGDRLFFIGHPEMAQEFGGWIVTTGEYDRTVNDQLWTTVATAAGGSGGPVIDMTGEVVGLSCCGNSDDHRSAIDVMQPADPGIRTMLVWDRPMYSGGPTARHIRALVDRAGG